MTDEYFRNYFCHSFRKTKFKLEINDMKNLLLIAAFVSSTSLAQTTYYSNQYGMPQGTATQSGNTTYFSNQYGMPQGTATQSGNTTYYSNQYGMPQGSTTTIGPAPIQQIRPYGR
jgi:hypothetical protein